MNLELGEDEWLFEHNKWLKIIEKVRAKKPFDNFYGFEGLTVVGSCEHCELAKSNKCNAAIWERKKCHHLHHHFSLLLFSMFVDEMCDENPDFSRALDHATKILAIIEYCGREWGYLKEKVAV
ncbi:MAG: hypothetical protein PHC85_01655 [Candidatus Pacebacteria bacterium]|nr:hypothetical protein [Candidatus Paceibacterota bacterium]